MKWNVQIRRVHYWVTAGLALPLLIIIASGLILQVKKQVPWVQPEELRGTGTSPRIGLEDILRSIRTEPDLGVSGWDDVHRVDLRPDRGIAKVSLRNGWEAQVDLGTGRVLQTAVRRSDLIESIHDGSFFGGDVVKLGIFLPAGIALLLMWITGLWMFWIPISARRRKRGKARPRAPRPIAGRSAAEGPTQRPPAAEPHSR